jgi:hypothetical protein
MCETIFMTQCAAEHKLPIVARYCRVHSGPAAVKINRLHYKKSRPAPYITLTNL